MSQLPLAVVVLAAGKGTRMKSPLPKVLHPLANKPMIGHALDAVAALKPEGGIVVLSKGQDAVAEFVAPWRTVALGRSVMKRLGSPKRVCTKIIRLPA